MEGGGGKCNLKVWDRIFFKAAVLTSAMLGFPRFRIMQVPILGVQ